MYVFFKNHEIDLLIWCELIDELYAGTAKGSIHHFFLEDGQEVNESRHSTGIKYLSPNDTGIV